MRGPPGQGWETVAEGLHKAEKGMTGAERETMLSEREMQEGAVLSMRCKSQAEVVVDACTTHTEDLAIAPENWDRIISGGSHRNRPPFSLTSSLDTHQQRCMHTLQNNLTISSKRTKGYRRPAALAARAAQSIAARPQNHCPCGHATVSISSI